MILKREGVNVTTLFQLLGKSGLNRNQVSKISGISNTYLAKLERFEMDGARMNIKRKTLINIAVSLNLSLAEINNLLKEYDHEEVSTSDTPYFLAASEIQTVTGILPLFSSLALEWFLIGMEKKLSVTEGASLEYVLDQPNHALKSSEHAGFVNELDLNIKKILPVHKDLVESACIHRRKLITEALEKGNTINTYICAGCLERYMKRWENYSGTEVEDKYKNFLREHVQTLVKFIKNYPDRYNLRLLKKCPRIRYQILYTPLRSGKGGAQNKINKVFFLGRESECNRDRRIVEWSDHNGFGQGFGDLIGFATDLQSLLDFFHKQHVGLKDYFVDDRFDKPERIVEHINELLFKNIPTND